MKNGDLIEHNSLDSGFEPRFLSCAPGDACGILGCRVLVRAERLAEQWPTDQAEGLTPEQRAECLEFRRFAARLADSVQKALSFGVVVGNWIGNYCPLGCWPGAGLRMPGPVHAANITELPMGATDAFMRGFDGENFSATLGYQAYYRLGQAYRKRFTK